MKSIPVDVSEFSDTALMIVWDDGHESIYPYEELRQACPCASCRQLRNKSGDGKIPFQKTVPLRLKPERIRPLRVEPIGRYAYRFNWSDKHDTGIYTFEFLRGMCSCEDCRSGD